MDLEIIILSMISKPKTNIMILLLSRAKKIQMNYLENRNKLTDIEYKLRVTKGEGSR